MSEEILENSTDEMAKPLTFPKSERLHHRTLVEGLFAKGGSLYEYPLRLTWRTLTEEELAASFRDGIPSGIAALQMMVTVPKKKRRHAVDRVRMRRLIREAYRLRRRPLRRMVEEMADVRTLSLAFIYIATENLPMRTIAKKMERLLRRLGEAVANTSAQTSGDNQTADN